LVHGVCRRVLRQEQDAEDAFQATFLVLARKAGEAGRQGSVAGWLHRVAYHAALKARARAASRQEYERQTPPRQAADLLEEVTGREFLLVLDEELQQLSEDCRAPLVLCYLQGHTCDGAARQLGWSVRTFKRRLERGRRSLRARLVRRGITLPAALLALGLTRGTRAAVPPSLTAGAVQAALDGGQAAVGALADAVLRGMSAGRLRGAAALLMLGTLVFGTGALAHQAQARRSEAAEPAPPPAAAAPPVPAPAAPPPAKDGEGAKKSVVAGRVTDADGKPVAGARVAAYATLRFGDLSVQYQAQSLGEVKADAEGRFSIPLPDLVAGRFDYFEVLAGARGYGPGWSRTPAALASKVELRLPPEEAVVGRLIDLQGRPLGKAQLRPRRVVGPARPLAPNAPKTPAPKEGDEGAMMARHNLALERRSRSFEFWKDAPIKDVSLWPQPVTTDAEGRFRVAGFGRGQEVDLVVEDDRVATQEIIVAAGGKERNFSLVPPHHVSGRVVAADTDRPVAGASVLVTSFHDHLGYGIDVRTDADGRYSANAYPGKSYSVTVYPPRGAPYLVGSRQADWPKGAVKQEADFKLPRGAVVRGKVVEAGTGKAIVSAAVALLPQSKNNPDLPRGIETGPYQRAWTGPDGTFEIVFPPGRGHLTVTGPSADYVYRTVSEGELQAGKPGGPPHHFHAVLPLELRARGEATEVKIELRRAVTLKGRLVGPDGKPVRDAVVFVPSELLPERPERFLSFTVGIPPGTRVTAVATHDGTFALPNCDPEKTYRVFILSGQPAGGMRFAPFIDAAGPARVDAESVVNGLISGKNPLGAVAELSAKGAAGKAIEVKLAPCQSAEVRFVDAAGRAVWQKVWLELLVKPGLSAEAALLASPYQMPGGKSPLGPDAAGRITIPGLIPGATYRLKVLTGLEGQENEVRFEKDFTVEAGKKTKLELTAPPEK
jgi:RNA polymerase sigma factor (sigma-70 family)